MSKLVWFFHFQLPLTKIYIKKRRGKKKEKRTYNNNKRKKPCQKGNNWVQWKMVHWNLTEDEKTLARRCHPRTYLYERNNIEIKIDRERERESWSDTVSRYFFVLAFVENIFIDIRHERIKIDRERLRFYTYIPIPYMEVQSIPWKLDISTLAKLYAAGNAAAAATGVLPAAWAAVAVVGTVWAVGVAEMAATG